MTTAPYAMVMTPNGPFTVLTDAQGAVLASGWTTDAYELLARVHASVRPDYLRHCPSLGAATDAVESYYGGDVFAVDTVPVRQFSGPFRTHAWAVLRKVPPGKPLSYSAFAEAIGNPKAVRAAASACAANAAALFVPCHRVVRADGSLGGFRWGLEAKRWLLDYERQPSDPDVKAQPPRER